MVHFMCGHSFNLRSLGENDSQCPLCTPEFKRVLDIRQNMLDGETTPACLTGTAGHGNAGGLHYPKAACQGWGCERQTCLGLTVLASGD